jgi:short-subunit dehydrogenase
LEAVAAGLREQHGVDARAVVLDLASDRMLDDLRRHTDDVDVGMVVYNGAAGYVGPMREQSQASLAAIVAVNCSGPLAVSHHFGGRMLERGGGGIVLMGSAAGLAGAAYNSAYSASKAFAIVLGEALWAEWHPQGVDVISVIGPAIDTPNFRAALEEGIDNMPDAIAPAVVVDETLEALGTTPSFVPGERVREMLAMLGTLPRRQQVEALSAAHARFADHPHDV